MTSIIDNILNCEFPEYNKRIFFPPFENPFLCKKKNLRKKLFRVWKNGVIKYSSSRMKK